MASAGESGGPGASSAARDRVVVFGGAGGHDRAGNEEQQKTDMSEITSCIQPQWIGATSARDVMVLDDGFDAAGTYLFSLGINGIFDL